MAENIKLKDYFGVNLAELLAEKITHIYPDFNSRNFITNVKNNYKPLELKARTSLIAESLQKNLPEYKKAIQILINIMGEPNPHETGMFKNYYWLMPVSDFIIKYGTEHEKESIKAIYELTQRCTGEYAIRPFITNNPEKLIKIMHKWSLDKSFHVRRLATEGLRPKLPWAPKLEVFIANYKPVFEILENLKEDKIKFVKKSVANNLNDYLKVNEPAANKLLKQWQKSSNPDTIWICKHATRNLRKLNK